MSEPEYINPHKLFVGSFIPNWLMGREEISPGVKLCYARLMQYADKDTGVAWPRRDTLAKELGVCTSQVDRYLAELKQAGLVEIRRQGQKKTNLYRFIRHEWMEFCESADTQSLESADMQSSESADMKNKENHRRESKERKKGGKPP